MKPVKAWAVVDNYEKELCADAVFSSKKMATASMLIGKREHLVRVEIRELKPKRKRAGGGE